MREQRIKEQPPLMVRPENGPQNPPMDNGAITGVGSLMIGSLPPIASGADVYSRQFYRGSRVPFRRYLPANGV